jgi:hypothetical protein
MMYMQQRRTIYETGAHDENKSVCILFKAHMNMRQARNVIRYQPDPSTTPTAYLWLKFVPTSHMNRTDAFLVFGEVKWHGFLLTLTELPGLADLVVPSRTGGFDGWRGFKFGLCRDCDQIWQFRTL